MMRTGHLQILKISIQKIAINYKVRGKKNKNKNTNFTGEKPRMSRISYYKSVFPF